MPPSSTIAVRGSIDISGSIERISLRNILTVGLPHFKIGSVIEVIRSTDVSATPPEVWAALGDFGAISGWVDNVDHSCLMTDRTDGPGTVRRIQTGRTTVVERVVTWEPPSILTYSLEGLPPIVKSATNTWVVEAAQVGSHVSLISRIDAGPRAPQRLVANIVGRKLAQASDVMLAGLRERCS